ncbi:MAG: hypothetical protein HOI66_16540, partial [Verrucomicrobia bacterium]|nr:hypothetical protein [Verrucomicrobiota bacterium]
MTLSKEALIRLVILVSVAAVSNLRSLAEVRSQNQVFPGKTWQTSTPETEGLDSRFLNEATGYLKQHSGSDGVNQLLIIRNGKIVWAGKDVEVVHGIWSVTKSFTST